MLRICVVPLTPSKQQFAHGEILGQFLWYLRYFLSVPLHRKVRNRSIRKRYTGRKPDVVDHAALHCLLGALYISKKFSRHGKFHDCPQVALTASSCHNDCCPSCDLSISRCSLLSRADENVRFGVIESGRTSFRLIQYGFRSVLPRSQGQGIENIARMIFFCQAHLPLDSSCA